MWARERDIRRLHHCSSDLREDVAHLVSFVRHRQIFISCSGKFILRSLNFRINLDRPMERRNPQKKLNYCLVNISVNPFDWRPKIVNNDENEDRGPSFASVSSGSDLISSADISLPRHNWTNTEFPEYISFQRNRWNSKNFTLMTIALWPSI